MDNQGIAAKRKAWKDVTGEFNKRPGHLVPRTKDQLKKLYGGGVMKILSQRILIWN